MNELQVFAVKDIKSGLFAHMHFMPSLGVAARSFGSACEDPNTELNKYPSDFSLYHLGKVDVETGLITPIDHPKQIANASEFAALSEVAE